MRGLFRFCTPFSGVASNALFDTKSAALFLSLNTVIRQFERDAVDIPEDDLIE